MAEEALKKLDQQLNCSICFDTFTDPKLLQCFHVYCRECLEQLIVQDQQEKLGLTCPTCRQVTPIPDRGVAGLQSAFHINPLLEIQDVFQKVGHPEEGAVGGAMIDTPPRNVGRCFEHEEEYKLYCGTCGELICWKCGIKGGKHRDHDYEELKSAFRNYKEEITASLEPMEKQVAAIQKALAQLDTSSGEISDQRAAIKESIHISFRRLQEVLNVRETELIGQLHRMTQEKLKCLAAQRDQIETTLARLNSCLHFMRESLKTSSEEDVLIMKANTVSQVKELTAPFQPDTLEPNAKADIIFSPSADATAVCRDYGCFLLSKELADPSKCYVTSKVDSALVGVKSTTILQAINSETKPCEVPIMSLVCRFISEITDIRTHCSVKRKGQSQYEISYQPTIKGRHQLHIRAEGQHIRGSPFSVAVRSLVQKFNTPLRIVREVGRPCGIAVNQRGEVVVTKFAGDHVSVFTPSGDKVRSFRTCGSSEGQRETPVGVAVDGEGNILVAVYRNNHIRKFSEDGRFIASSANRNIGLRITEPIDLAFNASNNNIYLVQHHCVQILDSHLTFSGTFGKEGSSKEHFSKPNGIACDSTGKVYVADSGNHRIQVFTAEGKFLRMFGRRGQGRGELDWPISIAVDNSGMVYVSELQNHRVSVFTSEGQFVAFFGQGLKEPQYLAVDNSRVVYVCDSTGHIYMF